MATTWWVLPFLLLAGCAPSVDETVVEKGPAIAQSPDPFGVHRALPYGESPSQVLDLYVPQGKKGEALVAFVHGGAWQGGSRAEYDAFCLALQKKGLAAASIDYRLSPAVRHPAHAEDAAHALASLKEHAATYGYDPQKIVVVGHSAGGHIAATIATDPKLLALGSPAGFVGIEGIYDVPDLAKRWPTYPNWFLNNAFGPDQGAWSAASPTRAKVVSHSPWLVVHSKADELVDRGQADGWAAHLRDAGVSVTVFHPEGENHFAVVGNLSHPDDKVAKAIEAFVAKLK